MKKEYCTKTVYQLGDERNNFTFCPERGGIIISLVLDGKERLYLNEESFADESLKVSGGIPVLFPWASGLDNSPYFSHDVSLKLPKHGFVRDYAFEVAELDEAAARVRLVQRATAETKHMYPFDYELELEYRLDMNCLSITMKASNHSETDMPIHFGYHPYFLLGNTSEVNVDVECEKCVDYMNGEREVKWQKNFTPDQVKEYNYILEGISQEVKISQGQDKLRLQLDPQFKWLINWALAGKPFLCLEPWSGGVGTLTSGKDIISVATGNTNISSWQVTI